MLDEKLKTKITFADYFSELTKIDNTQNTVIHPTNNIEKESTRLNKTFRACDEFIDFFHQTGFLDKFCELYDDFCKASLPHLNEIELSALNELLDKPINIEGIFNFGCSFTLREFFIHIQNDLKQLEHDESYLHLIDLIGSGTFWIIKLEFIKRAFKEFATVNSKKFDKKTLQRFEELLSKALNENLQQSFGKWPDDDFDFRSRLGKNALPKTLETLSYKLVRFLQHKVNWNEKEASAIKTYNDLCPKAESRIPEPTQETTEREQNKIHQLLIKRLALRKWKKEPKGSWNNPITQNAKTRYVTTTLGGETGEKPLKAELMWVDRINREVMSGSDLHIPIFEFLMNGSKTVIPTSPIKNGWQAFFNIVGEIHTPGDLTKIDQFDWLRLIVDHTKGINSVYPNLEQIYFNKCIELAKNKERELIFSYLNKYIFNHSQDPTEKAILGLRTCLSKFFQESYPQDVMPSIQRCLLLWKRNKNPSPQPYDAILSTIEEGLNSGKFTLEHLPTILKSVEFVKNDQRLYTESEHEKIIKNAFESIKDVQEDFIFSLLDNYIRKHKHNDPALRFSIALAACLSSSFQKHFPGTADQFFQRLINVDDLPLTLPDNAGPVLKLILEGFHAKKINLKELSHLLQAATFIQANTCPHSKTNRRAIITKKGEQNVCLIETRLPKNKLRVEFNPKETLKALCKYSHKLEDSSIHLQILNLLLPLQPLKTQDGLFKNDLKALQIDAETLRNTSKELLKHSSPYSLTLGGWMYIQAQSLDSEAKIPNWLISALPQILNASSNPARFLKALDQVTEPDFFSNILKNEIRNSPINSKSFYKTLITKFKDTSYSYLIRQCSYFLLNEELDLNEKKTISKILFQESLGAKNFTEAKKILRESIDNELIDANEVILWFSDFSSHVLLLSEAQTVVEFSAFKTFQDDIIKALTSINSLDNPTVSKLHHLVAAITNDKCLIHPSKRLQIFALLANHSSAHIHTSIIPYLVAKKEYVQAAELLQIAYAKDPHPKHHFESFICIASACSTCVNSEITNPTFAILETFNLPELIHEFKTTKPSYYATESLKWFVSSLIEHNKPVIAQQLLNTLPDPSCFYDKSRTYTLWLRICKKLLEMGEEVYPLWETLSKKELWKGIENSSEYLSFYIPFLKLLVTNNPESPLIRKLLPTIHVEQIDQKLQSSVIEIYVHQWEGMIANGKYESVKSSWNREIGNFVPEETKQRLRLLMHKHAVSRGDLKETAKSIREYIKNEKLSEKNLHYRKDLIETFISKLTKDSLNGSNFKNQWPILEELLNDRDIKKEIGSSHPYLASYLKAMIEAGLISQAQTIFNSYKQFSENQRIEFMNTIIIFLMKSEKIAEAYTWIKELLKIEKKTPEILQITEAFIKLLLTKTHKDNFNNSYAESLEDLLADPFLHSTFQECPSILGKLYLEAINQLLMVRPSLGLRKTYNILENLLHFIFRPFEPSLEIEQLRAAAFAVTGVVIEQARVSSIPFKKEIFKFIKGIISNDTMVKPVKETCKLIPILELNKANLFTNPSITKNLQWIVREFVENFIADEQDISIAESAFNLVSMPGNCYEGNEVASANLFRTLIEFHNQRKEFTKSLKLLPSFLTYKIASNTSFSIEETRWILQAIHASIWTGPHHAILPILNRLKTTSIANHEKWKPLLLTLHHELMKKKDYLNAAHLYLGHKEILEKFLMPILKQLLSKEEFEICYELIKDSKTSESSIWFPFISLMHKNPQHPVTKEAIQTFIRFKLEPTNHAAEAWIFILDILKQDPKFDLGSLFLENHTLNSLLTEKNNKNFEFTLACLENVTQHIVQYGHKHKEKIGLRLFELRTGLLNNYASIPDIETKLLKTELSLIRFIDHDHLLIFIKAAKEFIDPYLIKVNQDEHNKKLIQAKLEAFISKIAEIEITTSSELLKIILDLHRLGSEFSLPSLTRLKLMMPIMKYIKNFFIVDQFPVHIHINFPDVIDPATQNKEYSLSQKLICMLVIFLYQELDKILLLEIPLTPPETKEISFYADQILKISMSSLTHDLMPLIPWLLCHKKTHFVLKEEVLSKHTASFCLNQLEGSAYNVLFDRNILDKSCCNQVIFAIINFVESFRNFHFSQEDEESCFQKIKGLLCLFINHSKSSEILSLLDYLDLGMQNDSTVNINRYSTAYLTIIDLIINDLLEYKNEPTPITAQLVIELRSKLAVFFKDEMYHKAIISMIKKLTYLATMSENKAQIESANQFIQLANSYRIFHDFPQDLLEIFLLFTANPSELVLHSVFNELTSCKRKSLILKVIENFISYGNFASLKRAELVLSQSFIFFQSYPKEILPITIKILEKFQSNQINNNHKYLLFSNFGFPLSLRREFEQMPKEKNQIKKYSKIINDVHIKYITAFFDFLVSLPPSCNNGLNENNENNCFNHCEYIYSFLTSLKESQQSLKKTQSSSYLELLLGIQLIIEINIHDMINSQNDEEKIKFHIKKLCENYLNASQGELFTNLPKETQIFKLKVTLQWITSLSKNKVYDRVLCEHVSELLKMALESEILTPECDLYVEIRQELEKYNKELN